MSHLQLSKYNRTGSTKFAFAGFPTAKIYKSETGNSWSNHLLFGDYIKILDTDIKNGRVRAKSRGTSGWIKISDIITERVLEVNFVDVGQGDGCHLVTPDDKHFVIDAGKGDNMNRYLSWRFNLLRRSSPLSFPLEIVISHSDLDHYGGFRDVFDNEKIRVENVYHNSLVERPGNRPLGITSSGHNTGLVTTTEQMKRIIENPNKRKGDRSTFCKVLYKALKRNPNTAYIGLTHEDRYLAGFEENNQVEGKPLSIQILGPVTTNLPNGKKGLKTINDLGKDKNGHSVIMKLNYGKAKILLGGDVNTEFGGILHKHYKDQPGIFQVDVAKACHHGSNHFHYDFLESVNASATVISSGDDESYSHPRPDTLGAIGKCSYGEKPLIFSTEMARSNKEFTRANIEKLTKWVQKLKDLKKEIKGTSDEAILKKLNLKMRKTNESINSYLTKFGMINVRTDGEKMIVAQKLEREASYGKWDVHELKYCEASGRFELIGKH